MNKSLCIILTLLALTATAQEECQGICLNGPAPPFAGSQEDQRMVYSPHGTDTEKETQLRTPRKIPPGNNSRAQESIPRGSREKR